MSTTVTISGNKSELVSYFQPPLHLSDQYECGLIYFSVLKSRPSIPITNRGLSVIRIECDLVHGSYCNGLPTHFIHEFVSDTTPGHQCIEIPQNVIYFPVNKNIISSVSVKIVDQFGRCINFGEEQVQLRLHLRKTK